MFYFFERGGCGGGCGGRIKEGGKELDGEKFFNALAQRLQKRKALNRQFSKAKKKRTGRERNIKLHGQEERKEQPRKSSVYRESRGEMPLQVNNIKTRKLFLRSL